MSAARIAFVSMITEPWGGSEELWAGAATRLAGDCFDVSASVTEWSPLHKRVVELANSGVEIWLRPKRNSLWKKAWRRAANGSKSDLVLEVRKLVAKRLPEIIIFSNSWVLPPLELLEFCVTTNLPFVSISQVNSDAWWIDDEYAERYRLGMAAARRCYFVSKANLTLAERQLGCELTNAEVVSNPFNVDFNAAPPWLKWDDTDELRLACVARLEPSSKGQDVLLEALGNPVWAGRNWRLTLYGEGPKRDILERLALRFGIANRVTFAGHVINVESIWATNHALVMPSRFEGLPLAMVEAMLCGRPVLATDVAGHSEIVEDGVTGFLADAPTVPALLHSLERLWAHRSTLELIGKEAAKRIRAVVPADPVEIFTQKIKSVVQTLN